MDQHCSPRHSRRRFLSGAALAGTLAIAGCLDDVGSASDPVGERTGSGNSSDSTLGRDDIEEMEATPEADAVDDTDIPIAAKQLRVEYQLETLRDGIESGGVGQDGIPSIDDPQFESVDEVGDRLDDGDPVFGVVIDGDARAYPQNVLVWHEIVNDEIGGESVAVTYCPLTGTAMGHERGGVEFGVSGQLLNSNLIMYDREGETYWPQMLATAIDGPLEAASLVEVPVRWATWGRWREAYPDSLVLTADTGYARNYDEDPYGEYNPATGYYADSTSPMFAPLTEDDRLEPKRMVLGARTSTGAVAVDVESLAETGVMALEDPEPLLAVADPVFETGHVYRNPDEHTFAMDGDVVVDEDGEAYDPADLPLESVYAYDAMWFAWAGYYPSTMLFE